MLSNLMTLRGIRAIAVLAMTFSLPMFGQSGHSDDSLNASENLEKLLQNPSGKVTGTATFPIVFCWYEGLPALYIQTDASDPGIAARQNVNHVSILGNAINATPSAVDDIYVVTNFSQGNVIPSAPIPAGPNNTDPSYSPIWQVSMVTWATGTTPHTLTSEEAVKAAAAAGLSTPIMVIHHRR